MSFSEVAMSVLGERESVAGSREGGLQVAQEHVEPFEGIHLAASLALASDHHLVLKTRCKPTQIGT